MAAADASANTLIQINQGGTQIVAASGGSVILDPGATLKVNGIPITFPTAGSTSLTYTWSYSASNGFQLTGA